MATVSGTYEIPRWRNNASQIYHGGVIYTDETDEYKSSAMTI